MWKHKNNTVTGFFEMIQFLGEDLTQPEGIALAHRVMERMNSKVDEMEEKYGVAHNIEQVPAENASIKLCRKDKLLGYDMNLDLYSNQFLPLTGNFDLLKRIEVQGELDKHFSGGWCNPYRATNVNCVNVA